MEIWECAIKGKAQLDPAFLIENITSWLHSGENTLVIRGQEKEP